MNTIQTWTTSKKTKDLGWCKKMMMIITWQLRGVCVKHLNSFVVTYLVTIHHPTHHKQWFIVQAQIHLFHVIRVIKLATLRSVMRYIHVQQASKQASWRALQESQDDENKARFTLGVGAKKNLGPTLSIFWGCKLAPKGCKLASQITWYPFFSVLGPIKGP
jgi:hypothetical protein